MASGSGIFVSVSVAVGEGVNVSVAAGGCENVGDVPAISVWLGVGEGGAGRVAEVGG